MRNLEGKSARLNVQRKPLAAVFLMAMTGSAVTAQDWALTTAPHANWRCIASSADGRTLVAGTYSGAIYTSTNFGSSWSPTTAPEQLWVSVACSAQGTTLVAAAEWSPPNNGVRVSADSGRTWLVFSPASHFWRSVACSSDGKRLVASCTIYPAGGWITNAIYTSTNSGADWTLSKWSYMDESYPSVASSADGSRLAAAAGSSLYTSTDFGLSWTPTYPTGPGGYCGFVAGSGAGMTLVALSQTPGLASLSSDWGETWRPVGTLYSTPDSASASAACSADGATLAVTESSRGGTNPTRASVSTNAGALWSTTQFTYPTNLCSVASSADGSRLALALSGHGIYVRHTTPAPRLKILAHAAGVQLSWLVPSETFVLQESPDLSVWSDGDATQVLNYTNLHYEVNISPAPGAKFFRLLSR